MSVSRGDFLKQLGKSLPGMVLGSGVAGAAQAIFGKLAAATDEPRMTPTKPRISPEAREAKIEFIRSGPTHENVIALTFDDGPTPGVTDRILDELKQHGLHATFFMIGERVVAHPDLARRVVEEGHEIGNHTFTHANLTSISDAQFNSEIELTHDAFAEILGRQAVWFRPPFGALRQEQARVIMRRGMEVVNWTVDSTDWAQPGETEIEEIIAKGSSPGAIILCHDLHQQTANCLGRILDGLAQRDYKSATISRLLQRRELLE